MPVTNFDFDDAKSGRIYWNGSSYTAYTGWAQCNTGQDGDANHKDRAYFSFDTSSIPDGSVINSVKFLSRRGADPVGDPQTYQLRYFIGTFIGASLDGNVGEWTAGTLCLTQNTKPADKVWYDLGAAAVAALNDSGDTDLKVADNSTEGTGDPTWGTNFNKNAGTRCQLSVDYTECELGSATATGKGTASAAGTVSGGIEGKATATGKGTVSATAVTEIPGTATVKGVGTAAGTAILEVPGTATVKGVGTAAATAVQELPSAATVTGVGTVDATAVTEIPGVATVKGVGTVLAVGTVEGVLFGVATATGVGEATGAAVLEVPGVGTATGVGTALGGGTLWLTGTGIATGKGAAAGSATLWLSGLATATGVGKAVAAGTVLGNIAHWGEPLEAYTGGPQRGAY